MSASLEGLTACGWGFVRSRDSRFTQMFCSERVPSDGSTAWSDI